MAIDNSLYDALQDTYFKINSYLDTVKLGAEHSPVIIKHEALGELLETFDVEALEEQSKDINGLHEQLNAIKALTDEIIAAISTAPDSVDTAEKVVLGLDTVFEKIKNIVV